MYNLYLLLIIRSKVEVKLFPNRQETTHFYQEKINRNKSHSQFAKASQILSVHVKTNFSLAILEGAQCEH